MLASFQDARRDKSRWEKAATSRSTPKRRAGTCNLQKCPAKRGESCSLPPRFVLPRCYFINRKNLAASLALKLTLFMLFETTGVTLNVVQLPATRFVRACKE
jgi:hypothetical protein